MKFNYAVAFLTFFLGLVLVQFLGSFIYFTELEILLFANLYVGAVIVGFLSKKTKDS